MAATDAGIRVLQVRRLRTGIVVAEEGIKSSDIIIRIGIGGVYTCSTS